LLRCRSEALGAALGSFEMVLVSHGRTDLDYLDRIEALELALDELGDHLDQQLAATVHRPGG